MSVTKEKVINNIYNHVGFSKTMSRSVVENLFEIIKATLEKRRPPHQRVWQVCGKRKE
jgi:nucleoid DNA-binding protein